MRNKGIVGEMVFVVGMAVAVWCVATASFNVTYKTEEGKVKAKGIGLTELTKQNGRTIWCKMQGKTNCK